MPVLQLRQLLSVRRPVTSVVHLLLHCTLKALSSPNLCPAAAPTPRSRLHLANRALQSQPVVPLSIKGYEDVNCRVCRFEQPLSHRPDVQALRGGGGQAVPMQPPPAAGSGPPPGWGSPKPNEPMRYG